MKKKWLKKLWSLFLCLCVFTSLLSVTALAAATEITVTSATYYESGDVESLTAEFGWDTASATSRMTVMDKYLRSAGEAGTNAMYGDFTDLGYYGKAFDSWDEVLEHSDTFGMLYYADEQNIHSGMTNTLTLSFDEGDIPLDVNKTYYLYLWTYYAGHYYPDNLFMVLQIKDGAFQYATATGRNSYDSFSTLWETVTVLDSYAAPMDSPMNEGIPGDVTVGAKPAVSS